MICSFKVHGTAGRVLQDRSPVALLLVPQRRIKSCMDCPEHELWAIRDPDDWFSHDTRVSCRAAESRTIVDCISSGRLGKRVAVPDWCPRRKALPQSSAAANGKRIKIIVWAALLLATIYSAFYVSRILQVNYVRDRKYVKASELPMECLAGLELYGEPPENVGVWVVRKDIDSDGADELITDAGDYGRGAANSWYEIWKMQPSGMYANIGSFFCDWSLFVPGWLIFGNPGILCFESVGGCEWIPWKNGRYSGKSRLP